MKVKCIVLFIVVTQFLMAGCSITHPVAKDYPQFLNTQGPVSTLPKTTLNADYWLDDKTQSHYYEFRAVSVGYAHLWIVEFGKILDDTLKAPYVQSAFGKLQKVTGSNSSGDLIKFSLDSYKFENYRAYVSLQVTLKRGDEIILSKTYSAEGNAKGGQMWGAGPFGMKNATLDSTKSAIDSILFQFLSDISKGN